jgi:hypothetical protein
MKIFQKKLKYVNLDTLSKAKENENVNDKDLFTGEGFFSKLFFYWAFKILKVKISLILSLQKQLQFN